MKQLRASARLLYEEAESRGITCELLGDGQTILMSKNGKQWYTRGSRTSWQSSVGKTLADRKDLTKKVLNHFDLPTAPFVVLQKEEDLNKLSQLSYPVVMKPLDGRHGKAIRVGIESKEQVIQMWRKAEGAQIVEEMLQGIEYRVVCVDFKLVAAACRKPAHVVGDGVATIEELLKKKNTHPWRGKGHVNNLTVIEKDDELHACLEEQGYTLEDVVEKGVEVYLRKTSNLSRGGEAWDVTDGIDERNQALFEQIAKACDLNTIGIDIMCESLMKPIIEQKAAGVIEVNASPGLRMHHFPMKGKKRDVAGAIFDMIESRLA